MLNNLVSKLQSRRARIAACSHQEFLSYSKQFFALLEETPTLKAMVVDLLARNSECEKRARAEMQAATAFASGAAAHIRRSCLLESLWQNAASGQDHSWPWSHNGNRPPFGDGSENQQRP
jgi:hypothetical protein